jgi:hypothetical protein
MILDNNCIFLIPQVFAQETFKFCIIAKKKKKLSEKQQGQAGKDLRNILLIWYFYFPAA